MYNKKEQKYYPELNNMCAMLYNTRMITPQNMKIHAYNPIKNDDFHIALRTVTKQLNNVHMYNKKTKKYYPD